MLSLLLGHAQFFPPLDVSVPLDKVPAVIERTLPGVGVVIRGSLQHLPWSCSSVVLQRSDS